MEMDGKEINQFLTFDQSPHRFSIFDVPNHTQSALRITDSRKVKMDGHIKAISVWDAIVLHFNINDVLPARLTILMHQLEKKHKK